MYYQFKIVEQGTWFFIYISLPYAEEEDWVYLGHTAYVDKLMADGIFMTHETFEGAKKHMEEARKWFIWKGRMKKVHIPQIHK